MRLRQLVPLLILLVASTAPAQDNHCALKLSELPNAPELFGFRMGMTTEQVKARVPQVKFGPTNEFGLSQTSISPDFDSHIDKSSFIGVRTVSLDFLDGRTSSLWFGYDGSFKSHTVPEFIRQISQSLRLPSAWRPWKSTGQQLGCADFQMTVSFLAEGPSFRIIDNTAAETLAQRRAAKEGEDEAAETEQAEKVIADSKTKNFYTATCPPVYEIKEAELVVFKSKEDAENAGYKLGACRPHREVNTDP